MSLGCMLAIGLVLGAPTASAAAVVYEEPPAFCEGETVHDYLAPLSRMPKLHSPSDNGRVGFGPKSVELTPTPALVVGKGSIGYSLSLRWHARSVHPKWNITATLSAVDWRGRTIRVVDQDRRRVISVSRKRSTEVYFDVASRPTAYRLTIVFRSKSGRKLGGYGFYARVAPATKRTRLTLNADSYKAETTVFGRLENFGTATIFFGASYVIERLEGSSWVRAPESPRAFIRPLYFTGPGLSSRCSAFWIRPTMSGRYRMTKQIEYGDWLPPKDQLPTTLAAEFDVVP